MNKASKIFIAGHTGMVGSAIFRRLTLEGFGNIVVRSSGDLDLRNQAAATNFFLNEKPDYVFAAAAKVGGILANNKFRAEFLYDNLQIEANIIHHSYLQGVKKLLFLGSSCIYPKLAPQPLKESYMLSGYLEETNEPYAIAKIAGIKLCESYRRQYGCNFISVMPCNLYGPNDNFNLETSHVMPALIRKFSEAKSGNRPFVEVWGTGSPRREFMHVDDLADACLFLMNNFEGEQFVNVGSGKDITIRELAELIQARVGFKGKIQWDNTKPDGTPQKLLDVTKIFDMGWRPKISLEDGIKSMIDNYSEKARVEA